MIRETETTVDEVAELAAERPGGRPGGPLLALVGHHRAPEAHPEQQPDEGTVSFAQPQEMTAHLPGAAEDVDAARRHLVLDPTAERPPENVGRHPRGQRIAASDPLADGHVAFAGAQQPVELLDELDRLLEVRGEHGEALTSRRGESCTDRGERAEVARELDQLGTEPTCRQTVRKTAITVIGAAVDHEYHFELTVESIVQLVERTQQVVDVLGALIDGDDDRKHTCSRRDGPDLVRARCEIVYWHAVAPARRAGAADHGGRYSGHQVDSRTRQFRDTTSANSRNEVARARLATSSASVKKGGPP